MEEQEGEEEEEEKQQQEEGGGGGEEWKTEQVRRCLLALTDALPELVGHKVPEGDGGQGVQAGADRAGGGEVEVVKEAIKETGNDDVSEVSEVAEARLPRET